MRVLAAVLAVLSGFQVSALTVYAQPGQAAEPRVQGRLLKVGPSREIRSIQAAARAARAGDTIEIDAGEYRGDVAVWTVDDLTVRAVGGRARLIADGMSAEGKAIWVVRANRMLVENIDFTGARVPGRNGAGIRFERGRLRVHNCTFTDNENGILTGNDRRAELEVEASEFGHNGHGDGFSHNLYVGAIAWFSVRASYFHHARGGHLLKSRAAQSYVLHNRLTDESGGGASYELEFPSGGVAIVIGNILQQGPGTNNPVMVSFGAEGYDWPRNALYLVNNTLIDERPSDGVFLAVRAGSREVVAVNNLLVGISRIETAGAGEYRDNPNAVAEDFVGALDFDYRLRRGTRLIASGLSAGFAEDVDLTMLHEYVHPRSSRALAPGGLLPGAVQAAAP